MTVRPEAVALIADVDFSNPKIIDDVMRSLPADVRRINGTPLTSDEIALLRSATRAEWEAACRHGRTITEFHEAKADDMGRLVELTTPYFAGLPDDATTADVLTVMPDAERAEVEEILTRIAPDGLVFIEGSGS
jgi:hypothetical protein